MLQGAGYCQRAHAAEHLPCMRLIACAEELGHGMAHSSPRMASGPVGESMANTSEPTWCVAEAPIKVLT